MHKMPLGLAIPLQTENFKTFLVVLSGRADCLVSQSLNKKYACLIHRNAIRKTAIP
jgi:hypothetical protein